MEVILSCFAYMTRMFCLYLTSNNALSCFSGTNFKFAIHSFLFQDGGLFHHFTAACVTLPTCRSNKPFSYTQELCNFTLTSTLNT
jgi:hypothetical protein